MFHVRSEPFRGFRSRGIAWIIRAVNRRESTIPQSRASLSVSRDSVTLHLTCG